MAWQDHLYDDQSTMDDGIRAALMDTDLRISNLPPSDVKQQHAAWLARAAHGLIESNRNATSVVEVAPPDLLVLHDLRVHVLEAETNFRAAPTKYSIIWIAGLLLWVLIVIPLWGGAAGSLDSEDTLLGVTGRAWIATFVVGIAGSVAMVLSKIYRGTFTYQEISFTPRAVELASPASNSGSPRATGFSTGSVAYYWERVTSSDTARVFFRALVRPLLGGVIAVAIMLLLVSGLLLEPLVASLLPEDSPVDFVDAKATGFFLSVAFLAGFSEDLAWILLERVVDRLSGKSPSSEAQEGA